MIADLLPLLLSALGPLGVLLGDHSGTSIALRKRLFDGTLGGALEVKLFK